MKLVKYVSYPHEELSVEDYKGVPYVLYEECSHGVKLEVVVEDDLVGEVEEAIKGDLPDSVFAVLGISVSGEDLEEICAELKKRGFNCVLEVKENEEEYCESIRVELSQVSPKLVKVVIRDSEFRVFPAKTDKQYVRYHSNRHVKVEAVVPATVLSALEGSEDKVRALISSVLPALREADLDDPVSIIEHLEESEENYKICIERNGDELTWTVE